MSTDLIWQNILPYLVKQLINKVYNYIEYILMKMKTVYNYIFYL